MENKVYDVKKVSEICPIRPPNEELVDSLAGEWGGKPSVASFSAPSAMEYSDQPYVLEHPKMKAMRKNSDGESE